MMPSNQLHLPLKWHGGKRYLAKTILAQMPRHLHYVEAFAGGLAVLLARDPDDPSLQMGTGGSNRGVSEVVNDLDGQLANFWCVLGNAQLFPEFFRRANATPLSREFWSEADFYVKHYDQEWRQGDPIERALAFFVPRLARYWSGVIPIRWAATLIAPSRVCAITRDLLGHKSERL